MSKTTYLSAAVAGAALMACGSAQATGINRAWVSGHGTDAAGCGAPSNPCRSLQYVHDDVIAPGGEIDILDPAGYGAVNITKSISIVNDGVGTAGVQATSGDAITIDVAGANTSVTLRGLNIDGLGTATDGIELSQVGALTIANCVIRHFAHDGVYLQPATFLKLEIIDTTAADNGNNGFDLSPANSNSSMAGSVNHSYAIDNIANGLVLWNLNTPVGSYINLYDDVFSNNGNDGVLSAGSSVGDGGTAVLSVKGSVADNNSIGFRIEFGSTVYFSGAEAMLNNGSADVKIDTSTDVFTFGDNQFRTPVLLTKINPS